MRPHMQGFLSLRRHGRPLGRSLLLLRRRRCAAAPQRAPGGISAMTMGLGMAGAAVAGVALGAVRPTAWLFGEGGDEADGQVLIEHVVVVMQQQQA